MSSLVKTALQAIEYGRQNCIRNAKAANLPATDNMDIYSIGNLFLQQNNTEYIDPGEAEALQDWVRPSEWIDIDTVLENAPVHEGYVPVYIMLLMDTLGDTTLVKSGSGATVGISTGGDAYYTSDGQWYVGDMTHTWDTSQDVPTTYGYKLRYIIVYSSTGAGASANINLQLNDLMGLLELLLGDQKPFSAIKLSLDGNSGNPNKTIKSLRTVSNTSYVEGFVLRCQYSNSLENISLPNLERGSYVSIMDVNNLVTLNLPDFVEFTGPSSYYYNGITSTGLKKLVLPNFERTYQRYSDDYCYIQTPNVRYCSLPKLRIIRNRGPRLYFYNMKYLELPSVTTIADNGFASLSLPEEMHFEACTYVGNYSFGATSLLKRLYLPNCTSAGYYAFSKNGSSSGSYYGTPDLEEVYLPKCTTLGNNAFSSSKINKVDLSLCETIGDSAFYSCYNLDTISLPNCITLGSSAFSYCYKLTSISLPNCQNLSNNTFYCCQALLSISLPSCTSLGNSVFYGCNSLESVLIPYCTSIGSNVFNGCYKLREFTIPSVVATINSQAFNKACGLERLNFPIDFAISDLDLSTCTMLLPSCLSDIITKLKDVSEEASTYTLVLGETNLAKLTGAEIAAANLKGWTLS